MNGTAGAGEAVRWLASAAPDPERCLEEWRAHPLGVALLPSGRLWDVLVVTGALARPAFDLLLRQEPRPGPVLADFGYSRIGWFVPPGTASGWAGTGVRGAGRGSWIVVPYPGRRVIGGARWLVPPDGRGSLNDPRSLEAALHLAAASRSQES